MYLYVLIFIGIVYVILHIYQTTQNKKKIRNALKKNFGKNSETVEVMRNNVNTFYEEVKTLIDKKDQVDEVTWNDLEMDKIFQRINRSNSFVGEQILYAKLHEFSDKIISTADLEDLMQFYMLNEEKRLEAQCILSKLGKNDESYDVFGYIMNIEKYIIPNLKVYTIMNRIFLLFCLIPLVLRDEDYIIIPLIGFVINLAVYVITKNKYDYEIDLLSHSLKIVSCAKAFANKKYLENTFILKNIKKGYKAFSKIDKKLSGIKIRKTMSLSGDIGSIIIDYLIGGTLYDMMVYKNAIGVLKTNKQEFLGLFKCIGLVDASISITSYRHSLQEYCQPEIIDDERVEFVDFYHPLINAPIMNTLILDQSCIITGSNASGKSTAIKSLMINLLLGQSINTCTAVEAKFPKVTILTSMAVRDDIENNDSFYLKEIKYLKRIVDQVNHENMVICAIDEILKGTNMEERIAATTAILEYLTNYKCLVLITTHDIMIAEYMKKQYNYYYFKNEIKNDEIHFDYKMHQGIADCKNAILLLKHIGFPNSIVEKANLISESL